MEDTLDEDDLYLIEEATGVSINRDKQEERTLKRLKKANQSEQSESLFESDEEESGMGIGGRNRGKNRGTLDEEDVERYSDMEDDDDLSSFIVDELGRPTGSSNKKGKNRNNKGGPRFSSSQMRTVEDLFGVDFDDQEDADLQDEFQEKQKVKLTDLFEPEELARQYITPEDDEIRKTDLPEREQIRFPKRNSPVDGDIKEEAEWIFNNVFKQNDDLQPQIVIPRIIYVLEFIRKEHFEIPFIYKYKADYYTPDLKYQDLWAIADWDEKWTHLQNRKSMLRNLYKNTTIDGEYLRLLDESQSETEVADLFDHFQLYFGNEANNNNNNNNNENDNGEQQVKFKRAIKRDIYRIGKKTGLIQLAESFGLTAKQFGENLMNNYMSNQPVDSYESPEELANQYICSEFPDVNSVLKATRSILALEFANDPQVRQSIRTIYEEKALVTTIPTLKGKKEVDAFHPYRAILRIVKKPAQAFKSIQFLEILKAQKEGFIQLQLELPLDYHENELIKEMEGLYLSDAREQYTNSWNEQRKLIIEQALTNYLYPIYQKELTQKLTEEAMERVADKCAEKLSQRIMSGPYRVNSDNNNNNNNNNNGWGNNDINNNETNNNSNNEIKVMACVNTGNNVPTVFVVLDTEGELRAHLKLNNLNMYETDPRKQQDIDKLKKFIVDHAPNVIAVGAQLEAKRLYDELIKIRDNIKDNVVNTIEITYVDLEVPLIYAASVRSSSEFPDFSSTMKQAISVGRFLLDPLTEMSSLCNDSTELYCLRLHSLQNMVNKEYLLKLLERCFITTVNTVGVDINKVVSHKHASNVLQFVSGLGPRKALYIINQIYRRGGKITSREELDMLGPIVFTNCIPFLRIVSKHFNRNEDIEPLDDTRIHPNDYSLVRKMAADALGLRLSDEELILKLMRRPDKLDDIDLDAFADELERNGQPKKKTILYDIKQEITDPFKDLRPPYRSPDPNELFVLLTGETEATLKVGQLVYAKIVGVTDRSVRCRLDSGLTGFINKEDVSDRNVQNIKELAIDVGNTLPCRIREIDKERLSVKLTCKSSDLQSKRWEEAILHELQALEPYLLIENDNNENNKTIQKKKTKPRIIPRRIDHPLFQNITSQDAEKQLTNKDKGELIIRPSSRGVNYLTITWKFYDDLYVHINVKEEGKTNPQTLGKILSIGDQKFESLDEIIATYMEPIINFSIELFNFRNFKTENQEQVDLLLKQLKTATPQTIPYFINLSIEFPGRFILSYLPNTKVRHEFINVTQDGFSFRRVKFTNPEKLIKWFKQHWKEPPPPRSPPKSKQTISTSNVQNIQPEDADEEIPIDNQWGASSRGNMDWSTNNGPTQSEWGSVPVQSEWSGNNNNNNNVQSEWGGVPTQSEWGVPANSGYDQNQWGGPPQQQPNVWGAPQDYNQYQNNRGPQYNNQYNNQDNFMDNNNRGRNDNFRGRGRGGRGGRGGNRGGHYSNYSQPNINQNDNNSWGSWG